MRRVSFIILGFVLAICSFVYLAVNATKRCVFHQIPRDTIVLQPFLGVPQSCCTYLQKEVSKSYPCVRVASVVKLPDDAYYKPRGRYRADSLIAWLSRHAVSRTMVVGITTEDISMTKGNVRDWGVMGLGLAPGNAAVVSTYRLNHERLLSQLSKVTAHEIGHMFGLQHCMRDTCYMRAAEGKNHLDELRSFCPDCHKKTRAKGWK
jgi:archaemetzincin